MICKSRGIVSGLAVAENLGFSRMGGSDVSIAAKESRPEEVAGKKAVARKRTKLT